MKNGIQLIADERKRQITEEGLTPDLDVEQQPHGQLAGAAACYALWNSPYLACPLLARLLVGFWPWGHEYWKPKDPIRDLTRAGALIAAELDRLQAVQAEQDKPIIILPNGR